MDQRIFTRGDIVFVDNSIVKVGSEQGGGRPAVVVSNNRFNRTSGVIEIIFLTSHVKKPMQTHIIVHSGNRYSTALCEQIVSIDKSRVISICGRCTLREMTSIDEALHYSLGLL